ncbi:DUF3466 family protein [Vibrio cincinnatiensis]|uniref:DUF3466 family protein n=1 Tax=Vibrio cincinnatiensis TaxID=675 RepID=UPI001EDF5A73|nr:DUF3466 family protein [Vibrio cincinnatiensis]MCG3725685.1 DUF3466 family protein [Vibrio cincinnatiensis]
MSNNTFKRTLISAAILSSASSSAALYKVVEIIPSITFPYESAYGVAIQAQATSDNTKTLGCFDNNMVMDCEKDFKLAGETRSVETHAGEAVDGLSYREEVPFRMDNLFDYVQDKNDFERYCNNELRYSICDTWATVRENMWEKERLGGDSVPNAIAFLETDGGGGHIGIPFYDDSNAVINSVTATGNPIGIISALGDVEDYRRMSVTAFIDNEGKKLDPPTGKLHTRAWKTDGIYTVGSITQNVTNNREGSYTSKGTIWNGTKPVELDWGAGVAAKKDQRLAQGSLRDFVVVADTDTLYAVGFNTFENDRHYMQATVFTVPTALLDSSTKDNSDKKITSVEVKGATVHKNGGKSGDQIHTNSILTSVNNNLIAIGEAKRSSAHKGAYTNRLFIVDDIKSPTATFLSGGIFFDGAGGKAGAINNYNEIVGQVDADNTREVSGKPRRKRGFIYPYQAEGTFDKRSAIFNNQAWWLDDLTNDGKLSNDNNQYRIIDATDINDAGVIAATALKCAGGYDSTAHNATCGDGKGKETTVAVKLIPIAGATSDDIVRRGMDERTTERKGAAVGLWALVLLGLFGFRRK